MSLLRRCLHLMRSKKDDGIKNCGECVDLGSSTSASKRLLTLVVRALPFSLASASPSSPPKDSNFVLSFFFLRSWSLCRASRSLLQHQNYSLAPLYFDNGADPPNMPIASMHTGQLLDTDSVQGTKEVNNLERAVIVCQRSTFLTRLLSACSRFNLKSY